ncbi:MAG: Rrf2 family transcriptional regulator [Candidatus Brocadiia bacterium]
MRLSARARYGSRAMLDLALHFGQGPVSLREVCERQEVSESYMENLMAPLRHSGLVRTERGRHGGYALARNPAQITLGDIVRALDGPLEPVHCVNSPDECDRSAECVTRLMWEGLKDAADGYLDSVTLADMAEMKESRTEESR